MILQSLSFGHQFETPVNRYRFNYMYGCMLKVTNAISSNISYQLKRILLKSYMYSYCCPKHNRLVCNSQYFLCQGNLSGNMTWAAMQTHEEGYRDNKIFCAMACIYVGDVVLLTTPTILVVLL